MNVEMKWKKKTGNFQTGEYLIVGDSVIVGGYSYNALRPKDDQEKVYVGNVNLPNHPYLIANHLYAPSIESIKLNMELAVITWFRKVSDPSIGGK